MIAMGWIRQTHRWVSAIFTLAVLALFAVAGLGMQVAEWVWILPVAPLMLLLVTGTVMFVRPYLARR